jgi:hypothetical protein
MQVKQGKFNLCRQNGNMQSLFEKGRYEWRYILYQRIKACSNDGTGGGGECRA